MSDLFAGGQPAGNGGTGRAQNGSSRAASGPGPILAEPQPPYSRTGGVRTPTEIMRSREERMRRREQEAREEAQRRTEESEQAAGVADPMPRQRQPGAGATGGGTARVSGGEGASYRRPDRQSSGAAAARATAVPQASVSGAAGRNPPPEPQSAHSAPQPSMGRPRGSSTAGSGQPRPVQPEDQGRRTRSESYRQPASSSQPRIPTSTAQPGPSSTQAGPSTAAQGGQQGPAASNGQGGATQRTANQSAFPHAFERWETLSSHWEGLTSYWIRRLEQNKDEVGREPLNQQMARQITDLSAAGANLFHAVVELQRLRASSERKFQRWFFETRSEQERAQEVQGALEKALRDERQARADIVANIGKADRTKADADRKVQEMRRELQISKEEARRAWEELGRREQEERDRTTSLRNGEPTLVGGVQVVPMTMGVPSRQTSTTRPQTREGPYTGAPGAPLVGAQTRGDQSLESPTRRYSYDPENLSGADTDPFTETSGPEHAPSHSHHEPDLPTFDTSPRRVGRQPQTQQNATIPTSTPTRAPHAQSGASTDSPSAFYQQSTAPTLHQQAPAVSEPDSRSYVPSTITGGSSELGEEEYEIDDNGRFRRDAQGRPILYSRTDSPDDNESDEYDVHEQLERERAYQQRYGGGVTSAPQYGESSGSAPQSQRLDPRQGYGDEADYSGDGWGATSGWEGVQRHRHPTRLSDVLEEDERSRSATG